MLELIGDDAIKLAGRTDVSIFVPPKFTDGKGNTYKQPIMHVALCTDPVIPGLGDWQAMAANLIRSKEPDDMGIDLKKLQTELGIDAELTDENAGELILSAAGGFKKEITDLQAKVKQLEAEDGGDEDEPTGEVSPELVSLAQESRELKLSRLVAGDYPKKGDPPRLTPHAAEQLKKLFIGKDHLTLALSRGRANDHDHFDEVLAILAENDPVELGEKSGPQIMRLSRDVAENEDALVKDADKRAKAAKAG